MMFLVIVPYKWFFSRELYFAKVTQILIRGSYFHENDWTTEPRGLTTRFEILIFVNDGGIREIRKNCTPRKKPLIRYQIDIKMEALCTVYQGTKISWILRFLHLSWKLISQKCCHVTPFFVKIRYICKNMLCKCLFLGKT